MLDVFIAVVAASSQALTAYWGWRLIAHPLDPTDTKRKRRFELGFILCAVIGVSSVGIAAYRGGNIASELATIRQNTSKPPQVTVNIPANPINPPAPSKSKGFLHLESVDFVEKTLSTDSPFSINSHMKNTGTEPIYHMHIYTAVVITGAKGIDSEEKSTDLDRKIKTQFLKDFNHKKEYSKHSRSQMGVGEGIWNTVGFQSLSDDQVRGLISGDERFYILIHARWDNEENDTNICRWLQATGSAQISQWQPVWHICD